jgi:hypothetical protein
VDRFSFALHKIERANKHIENLGWLVSVLPHAYISTIESNDAGGQTLKYTPPDLTETGIAMSLVIGDAIHNLRTAIEYAYLGAVERHVPTELDCYTTFPTGKTREDVESRLKSRKIDVLSPKLFDRIISYIRPYEIGGNVLLKILHDLDISDKHWLLIPTARVADIRDVVVENDKGKTITGNTWPISGDGPYSIDFPRSHTIKNKGKLTVDVVFDKVEIGLLKGMPVMDDLTQFSKTAAHIIQTLNIL